MKTLHFSIVIDAPKEKVWDTMLGSNTYQEWTSLFAPGSYFAGDWSQGSKILFLAPGEQGEGGMVSRIVENKHHEFISIEHLGFYKEGKEDYESEEVKKWAGAHENYTFKQKNGKTEVMIDTDTDDSHADMMNDIWPRALLKLKELSEK